MIFRFDELLCLPEFVFVFVLFGFGFLVCSHENATRER